jgi:Domain of unknown function (DUF4422)
MIYVMTHKEIAFKAEGDYQYVGLGGLASSVDISDSDGIESIHQLNRDFCELTGLYHLWKNCDQEITGLYHYRRFLNLLPEELNTSNHCTINWTDAAKKLLEDPRQSQKANQILTEYDCILPKPIYCKSVDMHYRQEHGSREWDCFLERLDHLYGTKHSLRLEPRFFVGNMFIFNKEIFQQYCSDLFGIIFAVYKECGSYQAIEGARYQPFRYPGYLAERFMTAFINAHRIKFFEAQVLTFDNI